MLKRRNLLLFLAGAVIFFTSAVCGLGSSAPAAAPDLNEPSGGGGIPEATAAAAPTSLAAEIPDTGSSATEESPAPVAPPPAIPESRRLTLEYPGRIRAGDSDVIRMTLEIDTLGNITPTAEVEGNVLTGQTIQIPNLYETHNVIAEARLDLAGVEVLPGEEISEPLLPGQSATFYWSVHPANAGTYRGTAWLFLRFVDKVSHEESRKAVSAQTIQITATNLFGLTGNAARAAGGLGSILGAVLGFPFIDDVLKFFWSRLKR